MGSGVTLTRDGRLTATPEAILRLRALCAEDEIALRAADPEPMPSQLVDSVEAKLLGLIAEVGVEASRSLRIAREAVVPGELVEARAIAVNDAYRLSKAMAMLTVALSRHQGKSQRLILEHHVHRGV
jgi:hypothetical protein